MAAYEGGARRRPPPPLRKPRAALLALVQQDAEHYLRGAGAEGLAEAIRAVAVAAIEEISDETRDPRASSTGAPAAKVSAGAAGAPATAFARVMWDTGVVIMPDGRQCEMLIQSNLFHGKLRQLPLTNMQTLQFGLRASERWHLCNLTISGGGISCQPVNFSYKSQKKFLPTAPGFCSLWVYQKDPSVFALCAGPPNDARVLVMTADSAEDAEQWVRAIAGRLYLNELRLDDDMIPEFISIFYLFDTDGSGGISLDELQAASRGLGNPKSAEDLVATITNLQIELDSSGAISLPQFLCHISIFTPHPNLWSYIMNCFNTFI